MISCLAAISDITLDAIVDSQRYRRVSRLTLRFKQVLTKSVMLSIEFFIACMLLCLEYLHKNAILHRDIKPENLVFDENGYLRVTDLGIARLWQPENSKDTSGTPGYMAPEVMCR